MTDRPHRQKPTEVIKTALTLVGRDAQHYARTGPKKQEDALHQIANQFLDELQHRGEL
ncbi:MULTISPECIES: hypothetical protein [unclassified Streptomyces]|uniref:hypothetical protein n=1 Tax=unclassified Streptomyces TaxID=2593676 RepID=UPI001489B65B|nr:MULTISPECIES: hypothetical protein [unclassified Streptomyces]